MVARATDLITVTRRGRRFKASRRTVAHIDKTIAAFGKQFPHASLTIIQTCYNTGVPASAGTHDFDACFDFGFTGKLVAGGTDAQWTRLQRFARNQGWGADWRHTGAWAKQSSWHVHGFSLPVGLKGFPTKVGTLIDGGVSQFGHPVASSQLADYLAGRDGLADHAPDPTWRPTSIKATVFRYLPWVALHGVPKNGSVR